MQDEYEQQAQNWLNKTGSILTIWFVKKGKYFEDDKEFRDIYHFTLKNFRGEYTATFGASLNDSNKTGYPLQFGETARDITSGKPPKSYDILACIGDYYPETFDEFCSEFGYNDLPLSSYPKVKKIFEACQREKVSLEAMYTTKELELLQEIN